MARAARATRKSVERQGAHHFQSDIARHQNLRQGGTMTRYLHIQPLRNYAPLKNTEGSSEFAVADQFFSIQGEGHWTGTPAWFIRLQGCSVGCSWCDSKETWEQGTKKTALSDIVRGIPYNARHIVITGGEPYEQDIRRLLYALHLEGRRVQIETSGCFDAYGPEWITVSPKFFKPLSLQALRAACEIKQVVASQNDIDRLLTEVIPHIGQWTPVYLQPVSNGNRALNLCVEACKKHGFSLSLQTHKLVGIK
jgi:7-carboxy-7-deazaguanine synthase